MSDADSENSSGVGFFIAYLGDDGSLAFLVYTLGVTATAGRSFGMEEPMSNEVGNAVAAALNEIAFQLKQINQQLKEQSGKSGK